MMTDFGQKHQIKSIIQPFKKERKSKTYTELVLKFMSRLNY